MAMRIGQLTPTLRAFFAWWFGELRSLIPPRLRPLLKAPVDRLEVAFVGDAATIRWLRKRGTVELGTVALDDAGTDAATEAVRRLLDSVRKAPRQVDIVLPADRIMETTLEFPAAAEADLGQMLSFEMDRLTPFKADGVYFDYRIVARDRATRRIRVDLVVVPRTVVDTALTVVRRWGLAANRVVGETAAGDTLPWVIIGAAGGRRLGRVQTWTTAALAVVAAGLLVAIVVVPLQQKRDQVKALSAMVASARAVAVEAGELQNRLNQLRTQQQFLMEQKRARQPFVAVLDEITEIFPDDTWLFRLQYRDGEVQAYGHSQAASALIGLIGGSDLFRDPSFRAPVMRDPAADAERFHLTFRVPAATGDEAPRP